MNNGCKHNKLRRSGVSGIWYCAEPGCEFLITVEAGEIIDKREAKSERDRFEAWMHRYHADEWPNPDEDGSYTDGGIYRNRSLQRRWEAWQAAQDPAEIANRAQRMEFAAAALGVAERRRDELKKHLMAAREQLSKQPFFIAVRGCRPGDIVFLTPTRHLSIQETITFSQCCENLTRDTGIKAVLLPAGFSVEAKDATDEETCLYTFDADFKANPTTGCDIGEQRYKTGCGQVWLVSMGRSVYPFCAWCGKPVQTEVPPAPSSLEGKGATN